MSDRIPHLRTSERKAFKRCPAKWNWAYRRGLVLRNPRPGALWFGTGIHLALQERYKYPGLKRGKNVLKVWREFVGDVQGSVYEMGDDEVLKWHDAKELGEAMLGGYLDEYGLDERWHIISTEQTFQIPIPDPRKHASYVPDVPLVLYDGTFDLVGLDLESESGKSLWLWDHKTAAAIRTGHLPLDDQAGSYWAVAGDVLNAQGLIEPGMKLDGIVYNFLRKGKPNPRPRNADGLYTNQPTKAHYVAALKADHVQLTGKETLPVLQSLASSLEVLGDVSKVQPPALFKREEVWRTRAERRTQIRKIQDEALVMDEFRHKRLPIIKNPTAECPHDCDFYEMCELQDSGGDWEMVRDAMFKRQDPYADHRKTTEE